MVIQWANFYILIKEIMWRIIVENVKALLFWKSYPDTPLSDMKL